MTHDDRFKKKEERTKEQQNFITYVTIKSITISHL